ncbi:unnamed protein product [Diatraea saccharalis]|uniref:Uncharacterized protein n=1 Tax=Diatraea saccharalis TaxID=40085 RepID=A0A9N9WDH9_9NEOP|nr:unnamed protein product [Diatraea saccharalis]
MDTPTSPIQSQQNTLLENLIEAEKAAENLRNKLSFVIREYVEEARNDSSMSSLALDVSKISVLKGDPTKAQFASSPNLSGVGALQDDFAKSRLKRFESASTSNLVPKKTPNEKPSKLRRISPNVFKLKKDSLKPEKPKLTESKGSKIASLLRPKIATPVTRPTEFSPSMSATKKKFNHIKSTIPRPTPVKKE